MGDSKSSRCIYFRGLTYHLVVWLASLVFTFPSVQHPAFHEKTIPECIMFKNAEFEVGPEPFPVVDEQEPQSLENTLGSFLPLFRV